MNFEPVEAVLREMIGLDANSVGRESVARSARRLMRETGTMEPEVYAQHLRADEAALRALIEDVVVPETWFFRDEEPFGLVAKLAKERRVAGRKLRLLSLPCSTGEEPYSLAITLLEAGFSAEDFSIDAVDISEAALTRARRAVYGKHSFRGGAEAKRDAWFHATADHHHWQLDERVTKRVTFHRGNVLDFTPTGGACDFIFCRNLLIYFDAETQGSALRRLRTLLVKGGLLFVGHAEAAVALREGLVPWPTSRTFAFTEPGVRKADAVRAPVAPAEKMRMIKPRVASPAGPLPFAGVKPRLAAVAEPVAAGATLERAAALADRGELAEARKVVDSWIRAHGPSAGAYYLTGLTADAGGDVAGAEAAYRKALYLEPKHEETLAHLALLLEKRGDRDGARRLRQRGVKGAA